ncbi:hypothetical protein ACH4E7_42505 [Kitasatospora sp. NPDC018058]|uniref:hypothetical protein n=1 Tax=Kitasatospora sp. NPDC018058 TaxID=3364025 RepID=UPI0037C07D28
MTKRKPAGACRSLPLPMMTGRLPVIEVIGAAVARAMNTTPTTPTDPAFRDWWIGGSWTVVD